MGNRPLRVDAEALGQSREVDERILEGIADGGGLSGDAALPRQLVATADVGPNGSLELVGRLDPGPGDEALSLFLPSEVPAGPPRLSTAGTPPPIAALPALLGNLGGER